MSYLKYSLILKNGSEYKLTTDNLSFIESASIISGNDVFTFDNKIIEKTGLEGSLSLRNSRATGRKIILSIHRAYEDYIDYKEQANVLIQNFRDAEYFAELDDDGNIKKTIQIKLSSYELSYDKGSYQLSGSDAITMDAIDPFWSEYEQNEKKANIVPAATLKTIDIANGGNLSTFPLVTISAASACDLVQIYNQLGEGIEIIDPIFGTSGFDTITIDCINGTVKIGDSDRSPYITKGTGFFSLDIGSNTFSVYTTKQTSVSIFWNKRFYL